jgi:hypothetical protein
MAQRVPLRIRNVAGPCNAKNDLMWGRDWNASRRVLRKYFGTYLLRANIFVHQNTCCCLLRPTSTISSANIA